MTAKLMNDMIDNRLFTEWTKVLGFAITDKEKVLLILYWIPKMHENLTGARFIIAS